MMSFKHSLTTSGASPRATLMLSVSDSISVVCRGATGTNNNTDGHTHRHAHTHTHTVSTRDTPLREHTRRSTRTSLNGNINSKLPMDPSTSPPKAPSIASPWKGSGPSSGAALASLDAASPPLLSPPPPDFASPDGVASVRASATLRSPRGALALGSSPLPLPPSRLLLRLRPPSSDDEPRDPPRVRPPASALPRLLDSAADVPVLLVMVRLDEELRTPRAPAGRNAAARGCDGLMFRLDAGGGGRRLALPRAPPLTVRRLLPDLRMREPLPTFLASSCVAHTVSGVVACTHAHNTQAYNTLTGAQHRGVPQSTACEANELPPFVGHPPCP